MASTAQTATLPFSLETLNQLTPNQKVGGLAAIAFAIALLTGIWMWSKNIEYSVLFSNVSDRDGGQIVATLQQMNVPYKFSEGGGAILVPATRVHDTRLRLASQGLPKGGLVGFEVMETQKLGASQFLEQVNYQRALEGELARSIQTLQAVQAARVHLAIPKQSAFLRDEQKPTASVVLSLYPGRALESAQVAGIVHLVASSVSQLTPNNVSVIDQNGTLVSKNGDPARDNGLDPAQLKYLSDLEQTTTRRIEAILEPIVGAGNVRAQVAADIDFSQVEQMAETYVPNPATNAAIRSQQTSETSNAAAGAALGVPGALSNQPPVPAIAPITSPSVAGQSNAAGAGAESPQVQSRNATINYELDKTIRHTRSSFGAIKRLSVAVVVNHKKSAPDSEGKVKTTPLSAAEMQQVNELVREAMGYNQERGDTLNVANVSFNPVEKETLAEIPLWQNVGLLAMARESVKYVLVAIVALLLWNKMLNPLFRAWTRAAEERRKMLELANQERALEQSASAPRRKYDAKLADARDLAKQDPKVVADVIKGWVSGNE
ncbi:flagellar basal-body MS-ring and collar protein [Sterolibacterium denitrificans]|uniref:Flagellar basal-body MS-ring and collar protein n=2 Tax=Sterolibacterium denitrificans TaxID=157592 RepID=A0A7Z7HUN8_9PROT|nr:flagellar basal-body MS-ring/collar protein FliF [Sterolibacterium denitrificans]KYC29301.1 flagellar M-ring protein FliF [Sterolibacterium denitrificans]SMB30601.1 flagellar basal-body MS-ring and collar protein [Sterolibacterium denitrificans]